MSNGIVSFILNLFSSDPLFHIEQDGDAVIITVDVSEYLNADNVVASSTIEDGELTVRVSPDDE